MPKDTPAMPAATSGNARWGIHDSDERVELREPEQYVFVVADSGELRRLFLRSGAQQALFEAGNQVAAVSEDGTVFLLRDGPNGGSSHWLVVDDAGRAREITSFDGVALAALSRDGSRVAMGSTLAESAFPAYAASTIHLVDTTTLETRELAGEAQRVFVQLSWSRDQRHLIAVTTGPGMGSTATHLVDISTGERRPLGQDEAARELDWDDPQPLQECGNRKLRMAIAPHGGGREGVLLEEGDARSMLFEFRTTGPFDFGVGAVNDLVFSLHCEYLLVQLGYEELWIVDIATRRRAKIFSGYLMHGRVRPAAGPSRRP